MGAVQEYTAFALALAVTLLSLFYGSRQLQSLKRLREDPDLPPEEARREWRQSWRRLVSSGFMLLIALLLFVAQLWLEGPADHLARLRDLSNTPLDDAQKNFLRLYSSVGIGILVLLFGVVLLALIDLWSIRRYGRLQHRKLSDDRRAMIARQLRRLREEKEGE